MCSILFWCSTWCMQKIVTGNKFTTKRLSVFFYIWKTDKSVEGEKYVCVAYLLSFLITGMHVHLK